MLAWEGLREALGEDSPQPSPSRLFCGRVVDGVVVHEHQVHVRHVYSRLWRGRGVAGQGGGGGASAAARVYIELLNK